MTDPNPTPPTAPAVSVLAEHVSEHLSVFVVGEDTDASRPANGGLRLLNYPSDEACIADGERLAGLMTHKHDLYGTGFAGGKIVARATEPEAVKEELISVTAALLESLDGSMITGCDLNTSLEDMERLSALTPHVLAAVGSPVDASAATAHGTLGAVEAVLEAELVDATPGRALVHGCGAVGGTVARQLVEHGWTVFTVDLDRGRSGFPGATPLPERCPWWELKLDLLLPCSVSGLINTEMASALRTGAVVPAANAPFQVPQLADDLRRRGIRVLPDPLVNAGAVIADSIERFAPDAWESASAKDVYGFVREEVRQRASDYLSQRDQGLSVRDALTEVTAESRTEPIGLSFGEPTGVGL
ncbi:glutamate dehydrogenase [Synechococcus sp. BS56D]|uniref:Glu/Leu/Phe/Val dehydrogenase dimerization domain-containing protein n=1 Tax=Synechococcus sp. BS56D TaxID=2055944 RepID=UPI00103BF64B|nr:Glu/Leu/Phe/Val dehydrogenase dimerization domain-containing protein [Synechococcus sp. BS56D]TCD57656.1 glutamate dehydrogenase [Synechococcus sp. BS56D]